MKTIRIYTVFILMLFMGLAMALETKYSVVAGKCATDDGKLKIAWCYNRSLNPNEVTAQEDVMIDLAPIFISTTNTRNVFTSNKFGVYEVGGNLQHLIIDGSDCRADVPGARCSILHDRVNSWDIHSSKSDTDSDEEDSDEELTGTCTVVYNGSKSLNKCNEIIKQGYVRVSHSTTHLGL
jgi:hypothetical protein